MVTKRKPPEHDKPRQFAIFIYRRGTPGIKGWERIGANYATEAEAREACGGADFHDMQECYVVEIIASGAMRLSWT